MRIASSSCLLIVLAASLALGGCGKSSTSPSGSTNNSNSGCGAGTVNHGTLTATINGTAFTATCVSAIFTSGANILAIGATDGTQSIGVGAVSTGPAVLNMSGGLSNGLVNLLPASAAAWTANAGTAGSSGSVTLTRLDSTGAAGTFLFTAVATPGTGATGTKVVTNGTFNVTF